MKIRNLTIFLSILMLAYFKIYAEELQKIKVEKPGEISKQEEFKEQGVKRITFANQVVLNIKKTDYEKDKIYFQINFGRGALSAPKGKESVVHFAQGMFKNGGLNKVSDTELRKSILGKKVSANFSVLDNSFLIQSETTPQDFELNLKLCRAKLIDSAFPEEAFNKVKQALAKTYDSLNDDMLEYFKNTAKRKITRNDNALSLPDKTVIDAITLNDIKEWLTNELNTASLEINVVGDIDENKTIELIATYLGNLPERQKIKPLEKVESINNEKFDVKEEFKSTLNKDLIFFLIPTVDFREVEEIRKLNLLGKILNNKISKKTKEKIPNDIKPDIEHYFNENVKNTCYFRFAITSVPENTDLNIKVVDEVIKEISEKGISKEDLDEVRIPYLEILNRFSKTNAYWLNNVLRNSTSEPKNLESVLTFLKTYGEINNQQINELAKKYLDINKKSTFLLKAKSK